MIAVFLKLWILLVLGQLFFAVFESTKDPRI